MDRSVVADNNTAYVMGISKFFRGLKNSRHGSSEADNQAARDNRSDPTSTTPQASSSAADTSRNSSPLPERTSSADPRSPPTALPVPTTSGNTSLTARPTTPLSQTTPLPKDATSLWNRAYKALQDEDPQLVDRYERLLSKELNDHGKIFASLSVTCQLTFPIANSTAVSQDMSTQIDDLNRTENRMDPNPNKRQNQLKTIMDRGLQRADEKQITYTLFGHSFALNKQVAQAGQLIQAMKSLIGEAVKVSPEASLAWAGVCVLLPVLTNPSAADEANRDGLSYVTFRIRYYVELERLLWPENLVEPGLKREFNAHIINLYQHILEFQIKTVLRLYRRWLATASRDAIRYDDWEGMLSKIKEREQVIWEESRTLNTIASQQALESIKDAASQQYHDIQSLLSVAKDHLGVSLEQLDVSVKLLAEYKVQRFVKLCPAVDLY